MRKEFVYAYTRLQARHGLRPDESTWQLVESHRDLANFIQAARNTTLSQWTAGIQSVNDEHLLEEALLEQYRHYIEEVAAFVPESWSRAVRWVETLTQLPSLHYLINGNTAYSWMLENPDLRKFVAADQELRIHSLTQSRFAPLITGIQSGKLLTTAWLDHWQVLWPGNLPQIDPLREFVAVLQKHVDAFSQFSPAVTWLQRKKIAEKLVFMFRKHAFEPVTMFVHLLLVALDIERLRAGVMQRCLFPNFREGAL